MKDRNISKKPKVKKPLFDATPQKNAFLPMLLATVCMAITLLAVLISKFAFNFSREMLSPIILQIVILLIPAYLCLLLIYPEKSPVAQMKAIGATKLHADYIFLIVFSSLLLISTSFLLHIIFGGVYPVSEGFSLLGIFTAGVGEYTVNFSYLILAYAVVPALCEELLFRGVLYNRFAEINENLAFWMSSIISATFSFTLGGLPSALLLSFGLCFIRYTSGTLQSCMLVHFLFNLYAVFVQTNLAKYFLSSQNTALMMIVIVGIWLISATLFFAESAKIFKNKADRIKSGNETSSLPSVNLKAFGEEIKSILAHRPTLICTAVFVLQFAAVTVISYIV